MTNPESHPSIILLMGPEGCGKSTIAQKLTENGKPFITLGDEFRRLAAEDESRLGDICRDTLANHKYMDPEIVAQVADRRLSCPDVTQGFIMDGAGRSLEEIKRLRDIFIKRFPTIPVTMIHLRVPGWESDWRLRSGPNARKRKDDTLAGILKRLNNFYDGLGERGAFIRNHTTWRFFHVLATDEPQIVTDRVKKLLDYI